MLTACTCASRVTTWADGFGVWHASVPDGPSAAHVARHAIRAQLRARGEIGDAWRVSVLRGATVGPATCHPRREYVEA